MSMRSRDDAIRWVVVVLIALVIVIGAVQGLSIWRSYNVEKAADRATTASLKAEDASKRTETSANDAKTAAVEAKQELEAALAQARTGGTGVDANAVRDALSAIHRIEVAVCGGPCPGG